MAPNLRDTLLAALARLPGTRTFHLHVLITSPRKHTSLFPFATPRPRAYLQDILVLLSESATPSGAHTLVTALEAHVYVLPSTRSAVLYVSKVDSTGQGGAPSPTATVARTVIGFYVDPATRPVDAAHVWVHLFARAQGQYLFPNSAEYGGKRVLSDVRLCGWWKRVFEDVESGVRGRKDTATRLYYVLPGYGEMEAVHALQRASSAAVWIYGHPYSQTEIPLPCPAGKTTHLGQYIPSFDDDPKSRFMDEIGYTDVTSPKRKRRRTTDTDSHEEAPLGELQKVSRDEFWERMSFRQECVAGAVTGFFTLGITSTSDNTIAHVSPLAPQPGQVPSQLAKRVLTTLTTSVEFSTAERGIRGTEMVEGAIRGLCEGIGVVPTVTGPNDRRTPERETAPPPQTPPPRVAVASSPNAFPEPETSLETYLGHIYGSVSVSNDAQGASGSSKGQPGVTVLTARKKKRN